MFNNVFSGKKILITGNTGFKGSWLTLWLHSLGAKVVGVSKDIPTNPSLFESLKIQDEIKHNFIDICSHEELKKIFQDENPDFVFHLAAQAIVSSSYDSPIETVQTNAVGTLSVLESIRSLDNNCTAIIITSDKCYENVEWCYGYRENDRLGGKDIYSGSKAAAEAIIYSHFNSFLKDKENINIGITRAGNVIGGGDWAKDRIVADCMRAWSEDNKVEIRSPNSTRPWQHVLEPLSGYLHLASVLSENKNLNGEAFNFGPNDSQDRTVLELIEKLQNTWKYTKSPKIKINQNNKFFESSLLKLNCDKALMNIGWLPNLNFEQTSLFVSSWYNNFFNQNEDIYSFTLNQINEYHEIAEKKGLIWTK